MIVVVLAAIAAPAVALAAASPVSPVGGAVVRSVRPTFVWSLPENERSDAIFVARTPSTTSAGSFRNGDLVDAGYFVADDVERYTANRPLYAGRYWWQVETSDRSTYRVSYSSPTGFRIPAATALLGIRIARHRRGESIDVRWSTNTRQLSVQERVSRGRKTIFTAFERRLLPPIGGVRHTFFSFPRTKGVKSGTLLKLQTTVAGVGHAETATRFFRAP